MRVNRILLSTSLVVVALVVQVSVLARLHLPGAVPDLLLLTVLGLALVYGHVGGALVGFGAGLLADLAPPADHAAGRYALVLCVIGYLAGLFKPDNGKLKSATGPMVVVVVAAVGTTLLYAGVGALVGDTTARHVGLGSLLFTAALYDLLDVVARRLLGVGLSLTDLEVPQASAEGAQEGEDEDLDDDEPDLDAGRPAGLGDVAHCGCLPLSVCVPVRVGRSQERDTRTDVCADRPYGCACTSVERPTGEPGFPPGSPVRVNSAGLTGA
jgi:rod shape-determining protein MreD